MVELLVRVIRGQGHPTFRFSALSCGHQHAVHALFQKRAVEFLADRFCPRLADVPHLQLCVYKDPTCVQMLITSFSAVGGWGISFTHRYRQIKQL